MLLNFIIDYSIGLSVSKYEITNINYSAPLYMIFFAEYAVYRCPNDATQFYIADFNVNKCYLKYYTLCDDTASYNDDNLDDIVRDLLCGCNPDYFMVRELQLPAQDAGI